MCHHFDSRGRDERTPAKADEDDEDDEFETPAFLEEELTTEVNLLTDGGDEE